MDYSPVAVDENYINRETHGYGMYGLRRDNEQARARFETTFAQQSYQSPQTRSGDGNLFPQHGIPGSVEDGDRLRLHTTFSESNASSKTKTCVCA
jgi:hypothetical protein